MKRIILLLFISISFMYNSYGESGDSINIDLCLTKAIENYPLIKQKNILPELNKLRISNYNKGYLPQVYVNGQATYQSDVTKIQLPTNPLTSSSTSPSEMSKDQYKISLDINQSIYDGGLIKTQKNIDNLNTQIDLQNIESELYKIKERILQFYFTIILLNKNEKILQILEEDVYSKRTKVVSMVANGIMLKSNIDVFDAELLKIEQQKSELQNNKISAISMLGELSGIPLTVKNNFNIPSKQMDNNIAYANNRSEMKAMTLQTEKTELMKSLYNVKNMPRLNAFGQLGYGRPALNMLNNDFDDFYIVGAKLSWNIYNWNQTKQEKQILDLQKEIINTQKESFDKNTKIGFYQYQSEMQKIKEQIVQDEKIIKLRESIVLSYSSQLENGSITSTEYMTEVYNRSQAELNLEYHKIQLIKAYYNYLYLIGEL
ncbi:MAG: hypothetical protein A2X12_03175 [Bacteroidetes bacterium GWE2_29_8]|nr:MAG: hypothetical protein A2X12_03175 [Bacteroidetes bacterium GWE2_29_8]